MVSVFLAQVSNQFNGLERDGTNTNSPLIIRSSSDCYIVKVFAARSETELNGMVYTVL